MKPTIKQRLDHLYDGYTAEFRRSPADFFSARRDPILFPHRYSRFEDIEAAAFLAATFAYGNVTSLCAFIERLLQLLGPSPFQFLKGGPDAIQQLEQYKPYYRLHKSEEILRFLTALSRIYSTGGTLYELFREGYYNNHMMKVAAAKFVDGLRDGSDSLRFLIPSPAGGSPCKRLNLFFRWMIRRDGIDFGLWQDVSPADLVMPTDTHIGRIAYGLGWIETPSLSWQKAEVITAVLRKFDPEDPTRYDFALCHESISKTPWFRKLMNHRDHREHRD